MIYNSIIDDLEKQLSPSNIGARKGKSPRDHLFVLYAVLNETRKDNHGQLDLVFSDIRTCFDSLWTGKSLLDLYENGVKSSLLNLIHEMSKNARIRVKTPVGLTDLAPVVDIFFQGETLSSIICTSTMDKISKDDKNEHFKYRNEVEIPKLGFIDDLLDINKCGMQTKEVQEYTRMEVNKRKLQLNEDKCARIHIDMKKKKNKDQKKCEDLFIDVWKLEKKEEDKASKAKDI